jgi:2-succinyl-5-enolpyruvyl-6-hydroxy-3-cyclohexene-1-carboxylate synthase
MSDLDRNALWAGAFLEELARAGVTDLCLAPGSRSAPLVLAAARLVRLRLRVHLDERSAAFFALGMGKARGRPAAVVTTSGTAVANLLPAVVEASQSETPLLVLTADRPHRLRDSDANQAIDQVGIFGGYVREFFDVAPPAVGGPELRHLRGLAARAVAAALGLPAGPVHLNFPFEKPLEPVSGTGDVPAGFADAHPRAFRGREDDRPWVRVTPRRARASDEEIGALAEWIEGAERGVIVAGPSPDPEWLGDAAVRLSARAGLPLLADPLSGARYRARARAPVISACDLLLKVPELARALVPDLVIRVGQSPTSAALLAWLEGCSSARQVVVDGGRRWKDHLAVATDYVQADAADTLGRLAERVGGAGAEPAPLAARVGGADPQPQPWAALWMRLDARAREVARARCEADFFEGSVLAEVARAVPDGGTLFVSSSMPVRDLDAFGGDRTAPARVLANRGASGIDGVLSTALGVSAAGARPTVAVVGDLAFLHDSNGLLAVREADAAVVFVVIHNDGGGIFHLLPVREQEPEFTPYFATPHGLDLSHLAALYGLPHTRAEDRDALRSALAGALAAGGSHVIEVPSDREENRRLRGAAEAAVRAALQEIPLEGSR